MTRINGAALALAAFLGTAPMLAASAHEALVVQTGENFDVRWTGGPRDTQAGGGAARLLGGGENATVVYEPATLFGQASPATMSGGGDNATIIHGLPEAPARLLASASGPSRR